MFGLNNTLEDPIVVLIDLLPIKAQYSID